MSDGPREHDEAAGQGPEAPQTTASTQASSSSQSDDAAKSPEELQRDIKQTREDLGDTVDALSQKADVKAQAQDAISEQKAKLRAKRDEIKDKISGEGGSDETQGSAGQRVKAIVQQLSQRASSQPLPYLGGALAIGVIVGLVLRGRNS